MVVTIIKVVISFVNKKKGDCEIMIKMSFYKIENSENNQKILHQTFTLLAFYIVLYWTDNTKPRLHWLCLVTNFWVEYDMKSSQIIT